MEKKTFDLNTLIKEKIEDAQKYLIGELSTDDSELVDQMTLGDKWDDPFVLTKACDQHSSFYARWATTLKVLSRKKQRLEERRKAWESSVKKNIEIALYKENKVKGMTANNAKPSAVQVDYRFSSKYNKNDETFLKYNLPIQRIEAEIDIAEVVVKAFEHRKDMLRNMSQLVCKLLEKDLIVVKARKERFITGNKKG
jgi:hypothetical protein